MGSRAELSLKPESLRVRTLPAGFYFSLLTSEMVESMYHAPQQRPVPNDLVTSVHDSFLLFQDSQFLSSFIETIAAATTFVNFVEQPHP